MGDTTTIDQTDQAKHGMHTLSDPQIDAKERLGFTLFVAVCFHILIIFGITFTVPSTKTEKNRQINVTLARNVSEKAPEQSDFIGQANQLGGGQKKIKQPERTPIRAPFPDQSVRPTTQQQETETQQHGARVIHRQNSGLTVSDKIGKNDTTGRTQKTDAATLRAMMMASLEAELGEMRRAESDSPRRRITSAAVARAAEAAYIHAWQMKIERIGNQNYPAEAKARNVYGQLTLKVAIRADGSLEQVQILETSGYPILDQAAKRIVHLAAPFAPLPKEVREQTDILEIVRIWRFEPGDRFSSQ